MLVDTLKKIDRQVISTRMANEAKAQKEAKKKLNARIKCLKQGEFSKESIEGRIAKAVKDGWLDKEKGYTTVSLRMDSWDSEKPGHYHPEWHGSIYRHILKIFKDDGFESITMKHDGNYYSSWIDLEFKWKK